MIRRNSFMVLLVLVVIGLMATLQPTSTGLRRVEAFRVAPDGSLTSIDTASGLPFGTQGIAAR